MIILKLLWKFTKFLLKQASKILGFLIVRLYLWIPTSFAVIFALCSALVPFSFMKYLSHFIVLMAGGTILSLLLFVRRLFGLKIRKTPRAQADDNAPQEQTPQPVQSQYAEQRFSQPQYAQQRQFYNEDYIGPDDIKRSFKRRNAEWFNVTYEVAPEIKQSLNIPDLKSYSNYNSYNNDNDAAVEPPARLYRTRKDPTLFIAEYPDRLE
ncbi:MAG TPA: hypothetical protein VIL24_03325, partial [Clostridia bacterium]